jgi:hypothetical protein
MVYLPYRQSKRRIILTQKKQNFGLTPLQQDIYFVCVNAAAQMMNKKNQDVAIKLDTFVFFESKENIHQFIQFVANHYQVTLSWHEWQPVVQFPTLLSLFTYLINRISEEKDA